MEGRGILMNITKGKIKKAVKTVIYGTEGIGKSTFASCFPDPLFIDTEGSTGELDVARFDAPTSWPMLLSEIQYVINNRPCKTLVIDTADWAERLCVRNLCATKGWSGIEDTGYGKGYVYLAEEFGKMLNLLQDVINVGINVTITAHAKISKFEQPDELGAYDRWELKLEKKTAPMLKEWADMLLFANYLTYSVAVDKEGKKRKAQGGKRVMYTTHHPCWDAKNRYDLDEQLPFEFSSIAHIFGDVQPQSASVPQYQPHIEQKPVAPQPPVQQPIQQPLDQAIAEGPSTETQIYTDKGVDQTSPIDYTAEPYKGLPKALIDLMKENHVSEEQIRKVVATKYYPEDMPIKKYEPGFIDGVLIGAWPQILEMIDDKELPF